MDTLNDNLALKKMIDGCCRGDSKQQERLYRTYASRMFAVCLRYVEDRAEAEDILQNSFIKVFEKIDTFKYDGPFEGWLRRIVVNTGIESFRKRQRKLIAESLQGDYYTALTEPPRTDLEVKDLMDLIRRLPLNYRTVFTLHAIDGYSHREISGILRISELSSRASLCRAREALRQGISKYYSRVCMAG